MSVRKSQLAPKESSSTSRARSRSADDRSGSFVTSKANASGLHRRSKPFRLRSPSISSTEHEEETDKSDVADSSDDSESRDYDSDNDLDAQPSLSRTPQNRGTIIPDPFSEMISRTPAPTTPVNIRSSPDRHALTDPGRARITTSDDESLVARPYPHQKGHASPCGRKIFQIRGRCYHKHKGDCPECAKEIQRQKEWDMSEQRRLANYQRALVMVQTDRAGYDQCHNDTVGARKAKRKEKSIRNRSAGDRASITNDVDTPNKVSAKDVHTRMKNTILKDLTKEETAGSVYLVQSPQIKGLVKVGYTTDFDRRKGDIERTCGMTLETVETWNPIRNIKRVEKLVKQDLKHLQTVWRCPKCFGTHGEWHKISEATAIEVVDKWVEWMRLRPYGTKTKKLKPIWRHLLEVRKGPSPRLGHDDHEARLRHWKEATLLRPSPEEIQEFERESDTEPPRSDSQMVRSGGLQDMSGLLQVLEAAKVTLGQTKNVNYVLNFHDCEINLSGSLAKRMGL